MSWPITFADVVDARNRLRPHIPPTPLRSYAPLDAAVGAGIRVLVKHENHCPTGAFKARNGLAVMTSLGPEERRRGVVAATRGNRGAGLAWGGGIVGAPVTGCVPVGNNPGKDEAMRGFGAELVEEGRDYDEAVEVADRLVRERGLRLVHSSNTPQVLAGAATLSLEVVEQAESLDAMVIAVGGGSQAVGALTVARERRPGLKVYGVQARGASAIHDSWHAGAVRETRSADTFADGIATRRPPALTFPALKDGLAGFVAVDDGQIAAALRLLLRTTHNLAGGAGAAGPAGGVARREGPARRTAAAASSGGNVEPPTPV